jgi:hypothetical protein
LWEWRWLSSYYFFDHFRQNSPLVILNSFYRDISILSILNHPYPNPWECLDFFWIVLYQKYSFIIYRRCIDNLY